ncbi:Zinc finger BED domain containing protein 4 [Dissostichus eleginoides]|uniref:Zinc finger BED domain containing protein 4 n=1 Tax=Dissostichus eleginoides TaxID=100907 RepID=A0AAD9CQQ8_DISEL|nr:Zinc finger BED domain containing protein 4 [Dissostichus eleginoides]
MLFQAEGPSTQGIRTLRQVMRESLVKGFSKLEETKMVVLACLLDPHYKNHVFSSDATLTKAKEWLKEDVTSQEGPAATEGVNKEEPAAAEDISEEEQADAEGTNEEDRRTLKRQRREQISCRSRIDDMFSSLLASHTDEQLAKSCLEDELYLYLKEPVIDRRKGDPLQWWRQNEGRFKLLAKQARTFLCPPPSSIPRKRARDENFLDTIEAMEDRRAMASKENEDRRTMVSKGMHKELMVMARQADMLARQVEQQNRIQIGFLGVLAELVKANRPSSCSILPLF